MHCNRINNEGYVKVYPLVNSCNGYPQPRKSAGFPGVLLGQGQAILYSLLYIGLEEGFIQKRRQSPSLLSEGQNVFNFLPRYSCFAL